MSNSQVLRNKQLSSSTERKLPTEQDDLSLSVIHQQHEAEPACLDSYCTTRIWLSCQLQADKCNTDTN